MTRAARQDIADMSGAEALPRRSGELAFHDEWERRVFALGVALCERGAFEWDDFRQHLIAEIGARGESAQTPDAEAPGYYEHWLAALEKTLEECGVVASGGNLVK